MVAAEMGKSSCKCYNHEVFVMVGLNMNEEDLSDGIGMQLGTDRSVPCWFGGLLDMWKFFAKPSWI